MNIAAHGWLLASIFCVGCNSSAGANTPPNTPVDVTLPRAAAAEPDTSSTTDEDRAAPPPVAGATPDSKANANKVGMVFENPIPACGPGESYQIVANYRCDDGSQPLGGNPRAGAQARLGSSRPHMKVDPMDFMNSHIVDVYEVPCASGPVTLYVCLYHCDKKSDGRTASLQ